MLVEEIMSREPVTVLTTATIREALQRTREKRIRHLPVAEGRRLVGLVTDRDLRDVCPSVLKPEDDELLDRTRVGDFMRTRVITVHPLDHVGEAARLLYLHKIGCLPVVSGGKLVGIVTETDILRSLVQLLGVLKPGSHVEVEVPDRPGMLAEVAEIVRRHRTNITSMLTFPSPREGNTVLVFHLETIDPRRIIGEIEQAGYQIRWPRPEKEKP
ncbi:MAG: CBS and ACT domain-containing protein [Firmicutes bacterium]|nr:CBS and ACT domain-containing protein [Bacillota bacterium]